MANEVATMLTADETAIVRALDEALTEFFHVDLFASASIVEKHAEVVKQFQYLEDAFPALAEQAADFWEAEFPNEPEFPAEGPTEALFELLISLRAFSTESKLAEIINLEQNIAREMNDVRSFSEDWDWERGCWK